ncbi:hypothetical protein QO010_003640 [Caulobacter ginsengisoli]|uniref:Uncharacterized protein n=1 Tax=Caulobacter ginsengisoli TaxID=400775 RepID=A0ABU0IV03_9CAUL|nr:hypothetical protein [Caulobacter ginsengisoli]MDQ0465848.1 hypothetical protein [Caulobacter ginsengisoli]
MKILGLGLSLWAAAACSAFAQDASPPPPAEPAAAAVAPAPEAAPAPTPPAPEAAGPVTAPAGTVITIVFTQIISSKTAKQGDQFAFQLYFPLKVGDRVLIPAGTPGVGEVVDASKAGFGGRPGELLLAVRYLDYQGSRILLRGFKLGGVGKDNLGGAMLLNMAVGPLGLLIQGGDVIYQPGLVATAKLNQDYTLDTAAVAPAPPAETPAAAAPASTPTSSN